MHAAALQSSDVGATYPLQLGLQVIVLVLGQHDIQVVPEEVIQVVLPQQIVQVPLERPLLLLKVVGDEDVVRLEHASAEEPIAAEARRAPHRLRSVSSKVVEKRSGRTLESAAPPLLSLCMPIVREPHLFQ
jgi:hypothetical protein